MAEVAVAARPRRARQARLEARLIASWAVRELHGTFRQSSLRLVWAIGQPLSVFAVYVVVFHWILDVQADGVPYLAFMIVGVTMWRYVSIGMSRATCLADNAAVLRHVYFKREIVPLSSLVSGLIDLGIGTAAMLAVAWWQGMAPTPRLLALPLIYLDLVLYAIGASVLLATVTVFVRDVGHAMPTISQLLFLATPIMYPASQIPSELSFLATLNPVAVLVDAARDVTLEGVWPSWTAVGVNFVLGAAFATASIWYIRSIEHRIVDIA